LAGIAGGAASLKKAPARPAPPQGLLAGIKGGAATLKKAPAPPRGGGLAPTLCDQLRGGVTLRHASQRKLKPVQKQGDLMSEIAAKLAERRGRIAAMQRHESDSDDDDDSGWDDSD
jgi:hypothetical protein